MIRVSLVEVSIHAHLVVGAGHHGLEGLSLSREQHRCEATWAMLKGAMPTVSLATQLRCSRYRLVCSRAVGGVGVGCQLRL